MRQPLRDPLIAFVHVGVHEGIGRRIVGLPHIAQHGGGGREHGEVVQRQIAGGLIERHHARHLGRKDGKQILLRLVDHEAVAQHSCAVDHTVQAPLLRDDLVDQIAHSTGAADVHRFVLNLSATLAQALQHGLGVGFQWRAASQHQRDVRGTLDQGLGENQAQAAGAAGDQVDASGSAQRLDVGRVRDQR